MAGLFDPAWRLRWELVNSTEVVPAMRPLDEPAPVGPIHGHRLCGRSRLISDELAELSVAIDLGKRGWAA